LRQAPGFAELDPRLGSILFNLAVALAIDGKFSEAEPLFERVLTIRRAALGPMDPGVSTVLIYLGETCQKRGEYVDAESFYNQALAISEKTPKASYLNNVLGLSKLALLYRDDGRDSEAKLVSHKILSIPEDFR
jgi:tetratricopeptide (TPR) repeat protein